MPFHYVWILSSIVSRVQESCISRHCIQVPGRKGQGRKEEQSYQESKDFPQISSRLPCEPPQSGLGCAAIPATNSLRGQSVLRWTHIGPPPQTESATDDQRPQCGVLLWKCEPMWVLIRNKRLSIRKGEANFYFQVI